MRLSALALAFFVAAICPALAVPNYELFLITPGDVLKRTMISQAGNDYTEVKLTQKSSAGLIAFSTRNLAKVALVGMLEKNKGTKTLQIKAIRFETPISNGMIRLPAPHSLRSTLKNHLLIAD